MTTLNDLVNRTIAEAKADYRRRVAKTAKDGRHVTASGWVCRCGLSHYGPNPCAVCGDVAGGDR